MNKSELYKNEFMSIREEIEKLLKKLKLKHSVDEFLAFDSLTIKKIQIKSFDVDGKSKNDFSVLSSESYYDENGKHLRTRSTIYVKKLTKAEKMGSKNFYEDFISYYKLYALFNRNKALLVELETFISLNYFENECIKQINFLYENIDESLSLFEADDEYQKLVKVLNEEKSTIKNFKELHSNRLQNKKLKKEF